MNFCALYLWENYRFNQIFNPTVYVVRNYYYRLPVVMRSVNWRKDSIISYAVIQCAAFPLIICICTRQTHSAALVDRFIKILIRKKMKVTIPQFSSRPNIILPTKSISKSGAKRWTMKICNCCNTKLFFPAMILAFLNAAETKWWS